MGVTEAARALRDVLGRPVWLTSIGVGKDGGADAIVLYTATRQPPRLPIIDGGWHGFKVVMRYFGDVASIGDFPESMR